MIKIVPLPVTSDYRPICMECRVKTTTLWEVAGEVMYIRLCTDCLKELRVTISALTLLTISGKNTI